MKSYFLLLVGLLFFGESQLIAQSMFKKVASLPWQADLITSDPLGHFYLALPDQQIIKTDKEGKELFRYSTNRDGDIQWMDASLGLHILVWFPDFNNLKMFDRTLQENHQFQLNESGILNPIAVGVSNDKNVWVYDQASSQLKKIDREGKIIVESQRMDQYLDKVPKPISLLEFENKVYVNDPGQGILVFDFFGKFVKIIPITDLTNFQIQQDRLFYLKNNFLHFIDLRTQFDLKIQLPEEIAEQKNLQFQNGYLFAPQKNSVEIWQFKP